MRLLLGELRSIIFEQVNDDGDDTGDMSLSRAQRTARWQANRPDIEHLRPGQGPEGEPLFKVGDRIVVDRRTSALQDNPWLETVVGKVKAIDLERGVVKVSDEGSDDRSPMMKYFSLTDGLHTFKLAPMQGDPFDAVPAAPAVPRAPIARTKDQKKTYRIYGKHKGAPAHTRLKGQAYVAGADTQFRAGEEAYVEPKDGKLGVKKVDGDHEQTWEPE